MSGYIGSKTSVTLVDGYTQAEADAEFVAKAGDTMTGGLTVGGAFTSLGIDDNATSTAVTIDSAGRVTTPYQPAFKAYTTANTNATIVASTWATTLYNGFNVGGHLSSDRFTAPIAGKYMFSVAALVSHGGDGNYARVWTLVNGADVVDGLGLNSTSVTGLIYQLISYSVVLNLAAGDYVQLRPDDSLNNGFMYAGQYCRWSGYLIG
jgi:hypothetical protein